MVYICLFDCFKDTDKKSARKEQILYFLKYNLKNYRKCVYAVRKDKSEHKSKSLKKNHVMS